MMRTPWYAGWTPRYPKSQTGPAHRSLANDWRESSAPPACRCHRTWCDPGRRTAPTCSWNSQDIAKSQLSWLPAEHMAGNKIGSLSDMICTQVRYATQVKCRFVSELCKETCNYVTYSCLHSPCVNRIGPMGEWKAQQQKKHRRVFDMAIGDGYYWLEAVELQFIVSLLGQFPVLQSINSPISSAAKSCHSEWFPRKNLFTSRSETPKILSR